MHKYLHNPKNSSNFAAKLRIVRLCELRTRKYLMYKNIISMYPDYRSPI